jgi:hypothetical protein
MNLLDQADQVAIELTLAQRAARARYSVAGPRQLNRIALYFPLLAPL